MLEFNIQIAGGSLVEINEPIGFDKVDFNLTRSEKLHSISSNFAGNSIEFEFNKDVHINVFESIIQEYKVNGFLGDVMLFISYNGNELFKGSFDFSTTQTDMLNYLKCQIVNKDKLYLLDKNKNVAVDLLRDKDLDKNTVTPAPISTLSLPPVELFKESIWEDFNVETHIIPVNSAFNNAQNTVKYEINDSITWMRLREPLSDGLTDNLRPFQLVSAKENLKNISVTIEYETGTYFQTLRTGAAFETQLWLYYGEERPDLNKSDWADQVNKTLLTSIFLDNYPQTFPLPSVLNYNIPSLPRGSGIWIAWKSEKGLRFYNTGSKITINGTSTNFYSLTNSIKYTELVSNAVKKIANINNVVWNINYYNDTYAFNGNLLRNITDKGFEVKWQDIAKQLNERNLGAYYNEDTDTLVIDHRNNILGNDLIGSYGDLSKKDFYFVTEDENFIVNKFSYKYSKFQAQKENNVNGNNASVHGESEWYIANKTFEGSIDVDLPFIRDSFMIEDIRQKALEYKEDTATNEDSTVILVETGLNSPVLEVTETVKVNAMFENGHQILRNDGSFSWEKIGISTMSDIYINDYRYYVSNVMTREQLTVAPHPGTTPPELDGIMTITIRYTVLADRVAVLSNGLLNQSFSVRQNIEYWRETLNVANYYNKLPITNTIYKENKDASIDGLIESSDIVPINALHTPRMIDSKILISVDDYFYLKNNKIGYINIFNQNNKQISIYLTELKALFLNGCNQMEATLKGWFKREYTPILDNYVITKYFINNVFYFNLNFVFDDLNQTIEIRDGLSVLYSSLTGRQICSPEYCMADYNAAKNYLLSL